MPGAHPSPSLASQQQSQPSRLPSSTLRPLIERRSLLTSTVQASAEAVSNILTEFDGTVEADHEELNTRGPPAGDLFDAVKPYSEASPTSSALMAAPDADQAAALPKSQRATEPAVEKLRSPSSSLAQSNAANDRPRALKRHNSAVRLTEEDEAAFLKSFSVSSKPLGKTQVLHASSPHEPYHIRFRTGEIFRVPPQIPGKLRNLNALSEKQRREVKNLNRRFKRKYVPGYADREKLLQRARDEAARPALVTPRAPPQLVEDVLMFLKDKRKGSSRLRDQRTKRARMHSE